MTDRVYKLEIFLPQSCFDAVRQALWSVDAGHIGRYDCCLSYSPVIGAWRPLAGTAPYLGRMGEVCHAPELKVEVTCRFCDKIYRFTADEMERMAAERD